MHKSDELDFVLVHDPEQIAELANLAEVIWTEYFTPITGIEKTKYLLNQMLSIDALIRCIADEGYQYYFTNLEDEHIGFVGIQPREDEGYLFLSKLYLLKEARGFGFGRKQLYFVKERAQELGFNRIQLTCARDNVASVEMYKHVGFKVIDIVDNDVGDGFQMNDFIMEWSI